MKSNGIVTYKGRSQTVRQWAEETGIAFETLRYRIQRGMPADEALTRPVRSWNRRMSFERKNRNRIPEGCCVPYCEDCPLPDCEYNGKSLSVETAKIHAALHLHLPDHPGGMNHQYPTFTGVRI